ncbi:MAG: hypothetical protein AAF439_08110 [Pseudomonadota bacterium]
MFRALLLVFALIAAPAAAQQHASLTQPGDTANLRVGTTTAYVFYSIDDKKVMQVTMLFASDSGETLRTRIRLDEGQRHEVTLEGDTDSAPVQHYMFQRVGDGIAMAGAESPVGTKVAANY